MTPEKWQTASRLVQAVLQRAPVERAAFVAAACAGDERLRQEVESLLEVHRQTGQLDATDVEVVTNQMTGGLKANQTSPLYDGRLLGHYQLQHEIGRGGMGRVYLAQDTRLGRRVALKLLPRQSTRNPERVHRFKQEARAASALNHPNILTIYEIGEIKGVLFLATEFVEGHTLRTLIEQGQTTLLALLEIVIQAAGALAVAHEAGIVHRDIKPENLMQRPDGYVKVLDFGIAKLTEASAASGNGEFDQYETRAGVVVGTVNYMSPEQARGLRVDQRTDVFSLGVVLYELTTGKKPFTGPTPSDVIAAVLKTEPPPLSQHLSGTPPALERILRRALKKEREQRYATATEFAADLKQLKQEMEFATRAGQAIPSPPTEFSGELVTRTDEQGVRTTAETPSQLTAWRRYLRPLTVGLLLCCVLAAALAWYLTQTRSDSIAVLPFALTNAPSANNQTDAEYLADGLTESLIQRLSQTPALKVIARNSVYRYKGKDADPQEVGQALHVRTVLNGRIESRGDTLDIRVELVDTSASTVIWSQRYVRPVAGLLNLQAEIASEIAGQLQTRLSGETQQRLAKRDTANAEAYQLYLRGRHLWNQRTDQTLLKSLELFQQAIQLDPNYARAYAALADTYALLSYYSNVPQQECFDKGRAAAAKALELDSQLAEPHAALGMMMNTFAWQWDSAEREFQRALALNPNYATAHHWYGNFLVYQSRFDEALAQNALARELDPVSVPINTALGVNLYFARRYDEAIAQFQKTLLLNPNAAGVRAHLAMTYEMKQQWPKALSEITKAVELSNNHPTMLVRLAHVYAWSGRPDEARRLLAQLQQGLAANPLPAYLLAESFAALGEKDAAFTLLNQAVAEHDELVSELKIDPRMDSLRDDPRFAELLKQVGFKP